MDTITGKQDENFNGEIPMRIDLRSDTNLNKNFFQLRN